MESSPSSHRFLFLGGLHRSGTSLVFQCLREHPQISAFINTGEPEDEGQHLQTVYPRAAQLGGAGVFGFSPIAHQTESSLLISPANRQKLVDQWSGHWDLSKPCLLEKTPQNLLQTRFLQALFPGAYFVIVLRDPIAVAYATRKWSHTSLYSLLDHWVRCHELFRDDCRHLENVLVVRYEHFVAKPEAILGDIYRYLGLDFHVPTVQVHADVNQKYLLQWQRDQRGLMARLNCQHLEEHFRERIESWGYQFPTVAVAEQRSTPATRSRLQTAVSWLYRGGGAMRRWGSRAYKVARKHVRLGLRIERRRRSAVQ